MKHWVVIFVNILLIFALACCEDSEERRARYAEKKPAPKPLERTFTPPPPPLPKEEAGKPAGPFMVEYKGEEIGQVTGMSGKNVLLVFYTPWCKHCAQYKQVLMEYAVKERGHSYIVAIDADKYPRLAQEFGVEAVPKTILYVEGMRLKDMVGNVDAARLAQLINGTLEAGSMTR